MEEPSPQRAYQGEGYAAVRFGGRNDSRENRRKMNTKDTRNTTADRGIEAPARTVTKDFRAASEGRKALKTAPKYDTKTAIRPFPLLRQKWMDFHNRRHYAKNEPETEE